MPAQPIPVRIPVYVRPEASELRLGVTSTCNTCTTAQLVLEFGADRAVLSQAVRQACGDLELRVDGATVRHAARTLRENSTASPVPELALFVFVGEGLGEVPAVPTELACEVGQALCDSTFVYTTAEALAGCEFLSIDDTATANPGGPILPLSSLGPDCFVFQLTSPDYRAGLLVRRDEGEGGTPVSELSDIPTLVRTRYKARVGLTQWSDIVIGDHRFGVLDLIGVVPEDSNETVRIDYVHNDEVYYDILPPTGETAGLPNIQLRWNVAGEPRLQHISS